MRVLDRMHMFSLLETESKVVQIKMDNIRGLDWIALDERVEN